MKKIIFILIIMLAISIFSGCTEKVPTMDELLEFSQTHTQEEADEKLKEISLIVDSTPDEEICKIYYDSLQKWRETQSLIEIDRVTAGCSRDELLMNEQANEKQYNNISVNVEIYYKAGEISSSDHELFDSITDQVIGALNETPYGRFKINEFNLDLYNSENNFQKYNTSIGFLKPDSIPPAQTEGEFNIQTIAYNFVKEFNRREFSHERFSRHGNVTLKRFGIKSDTDELYIEIPIYEADYSKDLDAFIKSLEGRSNDLYDLIIANEDALSYLEDNNVKTVTVSFYTPWDPQKYYSYSFDL